MRMTVAFAFAVLLVALTLSRLTASARGLTVDDAFRIEDVADITVAPDGNIGAFTVKRGRGSAPVQKQEDMYGDDVGDVWIASVSGGTATNLTHGAATGDGYYMPKWSPDGANLAMLSTQGGNVRLWAWTRRTGHLRRLTDRAVGRWPVAFAWISE